MSKPHAHTPEMHEEPDAWHRHTLADGIPQPEHAGKINVPILLGVFVATVVFVAAAILFTYVYFTRHLTTLRQSRVETTVLSEPARKERDKTLERLGDYRWADARAGTVTLPLSVARERVIRGYTSK